MTQAPEQPKRQWLGKLSGLPFFLLWTAVTSAALAVVVGNHLFGFPSRFIELREGSIIGLFGFGSGLLVFRNRFRHLAWIATWIALYAAGRLDPSSGTMCMYPIALLQAALFLGVRRRPWLWLGLPLLMPPIADGGLTIALYAIELARTVPSFAQLLGPTGFLIWMWVGTVVVPTLFLGAVIAWGMPPLTSPTPGKLPPTDDEPYA